MPSRSRNVGDYALGALLGRGATSEVFEGSHLERGDAVAIKLLRDEVGDPAEFLAEAARTQAIRHPNVVRVIAFGADDGCYVVMERIDGESLAARLAREGRLDEDEVRRLGAAIADGMQAAHDRGIVHRDLKPANVMLGGAQPKIVDFGIAKHLGAQSAVQTGRRIGTPAYMAPEQLTGGLIAPCVDVWALGVILFEAATGRLPFEGYDDGRCPQLFEVAPRVASLARVSAALDALVARCLQREPGLRPASMADVARALRGEDDAERITQDAGAIFAAPDPAIVAARAPRRRWWPIAAAVVAVAALGGLAAATMGGGRAVAVAPDAAVAAPSVDAAPPPPPLDAAPTPPPSPDAGARRDRPPPKQKPPPRKRKPPPEKAPPRETLD